MSHNNLFIFGAGASKADNAPLQNELVSEIFGFLAKQNDNNTSVKQDIIDDLRNFLFTLFPLDLNLKENLYPTFEELMGLIYFALKRDESFKGFPQEKLREYSEWLIALMNMIITQKLENSRFINRKFIRLLFEGFQKKKNSNDELSVLQDFFNHNFFLSTNYDIILDNALRKLVNKKLKINYCDEIGYPNPDLNEVKLFKPHGSLNWLICKSCGVRIFGGNTKIAMEHYRKILLGKDPICNSCKEGFTSTLIVPPTFFKQFNKYFNRNILISLENHLKYTKNLVFIGYSFPEADLRLVRLPYE